MVFKNSSIFRDLTDYALGGFTHEELKKLKIIGQSDEISEEKLLYFCKKRMAKALKIYFIEAYKEYCDIYDPMIAREKTYEQLRGIVYEYLGINLATENDLEAVTEALLSTDNYLKWQIDFMENFTALTSQVLQPDLGSKVDSGIDVGDMEIEETVHYPNLIQILEQISE